MPDRIPRACRQPGCPLLTTKADGYCLKHAHCGQQQRQQRRYKDRRPSPSARGYDRHWQKARRLFLLDHPLCVRCAERRLIVAASIVDHIVPHRGDRLVFWDRDNWQALCKRCHDKKTMGEDRVEAWY